MVEESLVEKEVYEAMVSMRASLDDALGTGPNRAIQSVPGERKRTRSRNSPEWEFVYGDGTIPEPTRHKDDPVPSDVMAVGDVTRDKNRPVAPYIPPTNPKGGSDPFGLNEKPMG